VEVKAMDRFTKACLVLIILLLAVIAARPIVLPKPVNAANHYKYLAVRVANVVQPQPELDKYAAEGWELTGSYMMDITNGAVLIFRK
jgi:hypothetical protein